MKDDILEGTFIWVSGDSLTWAKWHHSDGGNDPQKDCVQIRRYGMFELKSCSDTYGYICEAQVGKDI